MTLDVDDIVRRLRLTLRQVCGTGLPVHGGYAETKARAVGQYAAMIADAYASGALSDADMRRELDEIEHMTRRFATALKGLPGGVAEMAARAATAVVFGALRAGLSFAGAPLSPTLTTRLDDRAPLAAAA
jgi:hypothetical protein